MTDTALAPRPLEDIVSFGCNSCQNGVRFIRAIDEDLRKQVRIITKDPDSSRVPAHKAKIVELKEKKVGAKERLYSHIDNDH